MSLEIFLHLLAFFGGLSLVILTLFSAISTIVLPRAARTKLTRGVFLFLRGIFNFFLRFAKSYSSRDAILAYYGPMGALLLVPAWYALVLIGFMAMYWSLGVGDWQSVFRLSGSSLFTLGFAVSNGFWVATLEFVEALLGLFLVALLISYLPTMYSAFSRREQIVNMLDVRAGNPPSALLMLLRFYRIQGLDKLGGYWSQWEAWFADIEESHITLPSLIFFRSPRPENSWLTAAGAMLDAASITLSSLDVPYDASAALCIRAGFLCLRRIATYFGIPIAQDPHFPRDPISVTRAEFDSVLDHLAEAGLPLKPDRDQAWLDFAGWRVNYDRALVMLCGLIEAPDAPWSSDRAPHFHALANRLHRHED